MVFEDPTCRRWRVAGLAGFIAMLVLGFFGGDLALTLLKAPALTAALPPALTEPDPSGSSSSTEPLGTVTGEQGPIATRPEVPISVDATAILSAPYLRTAFVVEHDARSVASLRAHVDRLHVVFPDWYSFDTKDGEIHEDIDPEVARLLAAKRVAVLPRLSNTDPSGAWHGDVLEALFRSEKASTQLVDTLVERIELTHAHGVNVDIESIDPDQRDAYVAWLDQLAQAFHRHGLSVTVDVPLNDEAFDYEAIGKIADLVVLMGYDEHWATSPAGAVASQDWFEDGLVEMLGRVPAEKLIVGLGAYGYDWTLGSDQPAEDLGFEDALGLAERVHASITTDGDTFNSGFTYADGDARTHQVWFLDAVSAWNELVFARSRNVRGVSLWRMGLEEPGVWRFLGSAAPESLRPDDLATIAAPDEVAFHGDGELLRVTRDARAGRRDLSFEGRSVSWAEYVELPHGFEVDRYGALPQGTKKVALTFDDGPDPRWTPQILDLLRAARVHATFFVIGERAEHDERLVARTAGEGHLLGNHTFEHPDIGAISRERLEVELNATQRVLEASTGLQTTLFRAPYDVDASPTTPAQLAPLFTAGRLGYVTAAANVDSLDWQRPGTDRIVRNVLDGLARGDGNVVLLHDGGGDRSQTVAAVARLVPMLTRLGYQFVTLDELAGTPGALMRPATPAELVLVKGDQMLLWLRRFGARAIVFGFGVTTAIAVARIGFLGLLVARSVAKHRARIPGFTSPIQVVIPAFNEEQVIGRTLDALLASDYPHFSVTVVDDGSTDETAARVLEVAARDPRVALISQRNQGKSAALNRGFRAGRESVVVTIDADTLVAPTTLGELIAPFADPGVDAVCGNVQVGNVNNLLTAFQNLEYVTSQNYDRRAFESLNCISVVPGATGAWRRSAVLECGGYSSDTLTEDADLTLTLLGAGSRIAYAPLAKSATEAPQTIRALFKQRFRWSFGTMQCLWKHRAAFGRGSLGRVALPNMLLFQVLFPIFCPLGDGILVWCLARGDFHAVALAFALFLGLDVVASLVAFVLDRRPMFPIVVVAVQRFFYRQFMYVVTFAALAAALRGRHHRWNKLARLGSVAPLPALAQAA